MGRNLYPSLKHVSFASANCTFTATTQTKHSYQTLSASLARKERRTTPSSRGLGLRLKFAVPEVPHNDALIGIGYGRCGVAGREPAGWKGPSNREDLTGWNDTGLVDL